MHDKTSRKQSVDALIKVLTDMSNSAEDRARAAGSLQNYKQKRVVDALICALKDPDRSVREEAIPALGRLGDKRAVIPLINLLDSELSKERMYDHEWVTPLTIAMAFKSFKEPKTVEPLLHALELAWKWTKVGTGDRGRCYQFICHAIDALGELKDERAVIDLVRILKDHTSCYPIPYGHRIETAKALGEIESKKAYLPLWEVLRTEKVQEVLDALWIAAMKIKKLYPNLCDYCGEEQTTRQIEELSDPVNRRICMRCWDRYKEKQDNPETRTVAHCDWDDDDKGSLR